MGVVSLLHNESGAECRTGGRCKEKIKENLSSSNVKGPVWFRGRQRMARTHNAAVVHANTLRVLLGLWPLKQSPGLKAEVNSASPQGLCSIQ